MCWCLASRIAPRDLHPGFAGAYSAEVCPFNCSGNGKCVPGVGCRCFIGYSGTDCSRHKCASSVLRFGSGQISTGLQDLVLPGQSNCEWLIAPNMSAGPATSAVDASFSVAPITVTFQQFDLFSSPAEFLEIYDGSTADPAHLLANYSGRFVPPPVTGTQSTMLLRLGSSRLNPNSDSAWGKGVVAFYESGQCSSGCPLDALCAFGQCVCEHTGQPADGPNSCATMQCPYGTFGNGCDLERCVGTKVIVADEGSGVFTNNVAPNTQENGVDGGGVTPNWGCRFLLTVNPELGPDAHITLEFPFLEINVCVLRVVW